MTKKELREKISEVSNSEFPLIDFFNDIEMNTDKNFNTEQAYEDIEKIYNVFTYYKNLVNRWQEKYLALEKEHIQIKKNFKNSQTHSKNCYKKLKEKYEKLERAYKNNEVLVRDLNELINRNIELRKQIENLEEENKGVKDDNTRLWLGLECANNENNKLKLAIEILKEVASLNCDKTLETERQLLRLSNGDYELLKEVFESVGDECE